MGQEVDKPPTINIIDHELATIHEFVYLGCVIFDNLSLTAQLNRHIKRGTTTFMRLTQWVWKNSKLMEYTKAQAYKPCVVACSCMAAKPGPHMHGKRKDSMVFMCIVWGIFWASHGEISYQIVQYFRERVQFPYTVSWSRDAYTGLVTSPTCRMVTSHRTFFMVSWHYKKPNGKIPTPL